MNSRKPLTEEDRVLWSRVARTATPLKGKTHPQEGADVSRTSGAPDQPQPKEPQREMPPTGQAPEHVGTRQPTRLDAPTQGKLARGRIELGGRVDLHGLTQSEAHALLLSVLRRAREEDRRYILVITGKGSTTSGDGILRRAVPQWLSTPPFGELVSGYNAASRQHGGAGALYVRVRRRRPV